MSQKEYAIYTIAKNIERMLIDEVDQDDILEALQDLQEIIERF
jgi:hypothetical protein